MTNLFELTDRGVIQFLRDQITQLFLLLMAHGLKAKPVYMCCWVWRRLLNVLLRKDVGGMSHVFSFSQTCSRFGSHSDKERLVFFTVF